MPKTNKDSLTLGLFGLGGNIHNVNNTNYFQGDESNVIYFADAIKIKNRLKEEQREDNLRDSIIHALLNHAKQFDW